uniref:Zinc finger protein 773 n=1 Tax=Mus musculus TaxID=10090 RepID=A0A1B0GRS1_MOUSE
MLVSGQRKTGFTALCPELEGARGARLCPLADRFEVYEDPVWLVAGLERIAMSTDPTAQQNQTAVALQGGQAQGGMAFSDVAIYFLRGEWRLLDDSQRRLYHQVMMEVFVLMSSLGLIPSGTDITQLGSSGNRFIPALRFLTPMGRDKWCRNPGPESPTEEVQNFLQSGSVDRMSTVSNSVSRDWD